MSTAAESVDLPQIHAIDPLFTPKRMAALEDKIRSYARECVATFRDRGSCEFLSDFAFEFPVKVFLELMGLPQNRVKQFLAWEHGLLHEPDIEKIKDATRSVVACVREEIEDRRDIARVHKGEQDRGCQGNAG